MTNKDISIQNSQIYMNENPSHFQSILNEEPSPNFESQNDIEHIIQKAEDGWIGLLEATVFLREKMRFYDEKIKLIKDFENKYYSQIEQEAIENQGEYNGAKFEFRNGGKIFNFENIKEIKDKEKELAELKEKYKIAYEHKQRGMLPVTSDGEELELPYVSYRKSSMIVKLKK